MSHDVSVGGLLAQANFGKNQEVLKELKQRRKIGEHTEIKEKQHQKKEENSAEKSSYKVDKLLQSSWKVDKHRLGERLDRGPAEIKSRRKWTNLIHLGLGFL
jgi:hypothetical protein